MCDKLEFIVDKKTYVCDKDVLKVYNKKGKVLLDCNIGEIEILFYDFDTKLAVFFVTPEMMQSFICYTAKDPNRDVEKFYNYLINHGAVERLLNRWSATFGKHSMAIEREKEERKEKVEKIALEKERKEQEKQEIKKKNDALMRIKKEKHIQELADKALKNATAREKERKIAEKRRGCKVMNEEKYVCMKCNNIWYVSNRETMKNVANLLVGSVYSMNQLKESDRCSKCGSSAVQHKTVRFWVDKHGNTVDFEE